MSSIKDEILAALTHPEGEDGLYLENFNVLHEDEERDQVNGSQLEILDALKELIEEGKILADESAEKVIFKLV